ncbi:expressed unknown protein [Seminavis robusta]|uniref:Uncharacterized protein n=1 Tax=Seminavis robusta TaxID=568900 RepID=A0A9N8EHU4_9STRA|nr:expressed unknown protein [Seminavis robusta]|eukprot:Sro1214_g253070.1 n/a (88) ;mRNA; r:26021-26284
MIPKVIFIQAPSTDDDGFGCLDNGLDELTLAMLKMEHHELEQQEKQQKKAKKKKQASSNKRSSITDLSSKTNRSNGTRLSNDSSKSS